MVEEGALLAVQRRNRVHIFCTELEVEYIEVFGHALLAHRLGNSYDAALRQPAQDDLCHAFTVFLGNGEQHIVVEDVVFAFGEWSHASIWTLFSCRNVWVSIC